MLAVYLYHQTSISIHALLTEGDAPAIMVEIPRDLFQSTPSSRRATSLFDSILALISFQSTPSSRRATYKIAQSMVAVGISIHALLTEGDSNFAQNISINFSIYMLHLYDFTFYGI